MDGDVSVCWHDQWASVFFQTLWWALHGVDTDESTGRLLQASFEMSLSVQSLACLVCVSVLRADETHGNVKKKRIMRWRSVCKTKKREWAKPVKYVMSLWGLTESYPLHKHCEILPSRPKVWSSVTGWQSKNLIATIFIYCALPLCVSYFMTMRCLYVIHWFL